jgi:hypothetical protein
MIPISTHSPSEEVIYHQKASEAPNSKVTFTALTIIQPQEQPSIFTRLTSTTQDTPHSDGEDSLEGLGDCFQTLCDKDFDEPLRSGSTCAPKERILYPVQSRGRTSKLYNLNEDPAFRAAGEKKLPCPFFSNSAFTVSKEAPLEGKKRERQEEPRYKAPVFPPKSIPTTTVAGNFFYNAPLETTYSHVNALAGQEFFSNIPRPFTSNAIKRPLSPSTLDIEHQNKKSPPSINTTFSPEPPL